MESFNSFFFFKLFTRLQHASWGIASPIAAPRFSAARQIPLSLADHLLFAICFPTRVGYGALQGHLHYRSPLLPNIRGRPWDWRVWNQLFTTDSRLEALSASPPPRRDGHPRVLASVGDVFSPGKHAKWWQRAFWGLRRKDRFVARIPAGDPRPTPTLFVAIAPLQSRYSKPALPSRRYNSEPRSVAHIGTGRPAVVFRVLLRFAPTFEPILLPNDPISLRHGARRFQDQRPFCQRLHFDSFASYRRGFGPSWPLVRTGYSPSVQQDLGRGI